MKRNRPELVRVEWLDIASLSGWHSVKDTLALEPVRCVDCGWLLYRDSEKLVLFRSRNNDGDVGDIAVLPAGCVVRVTPLAPVRTVQQKRASITNGQRSESSDGDGTLPGK